MLEVWTVGGGPELVNMFNAVAAWTGGGGYRALLRVAMVMAFTYAMITLAFSQNWRAWFTWFLQATAIYAILMVPTVTVRVNDPTTVNGGPQVVANVPIGLGMLASFTTEAGYWMTRQAEFIFAPTPELDYSGNGYVFGARLFQHAHGYDLGDPILRTNIVAYMEHCVLQGIALGHIDYDALRRSEDIWSDLGAAPPPGLAMPFVEETAGGSDTIIVACPDGYGRIDGAIDARYADDIEEFSSTIYTGILSSSDAYARLGNELSTNSGYFHRAAGGINGSGDLYLRQVSMVRLFQEAWAGMSDVDPNAYAAIRGEIQARNTYSSIANQAMTWVPVLHIVLTIVFFAMFPVLFPLFLMPTIGVSILRGYATGFFYLAAWGPLYAILHMFVMGQAEDGYASMPGQTLTIGNYESAFTIGNEIGTMAGFLLMSVPFLAAGLARGAMAIGSQATSMLMPAQQAAEAAAGEATTGSYSYGNTQFANRTSAMVQANRFDTRPTSSIGFGMSSFALADGSAARGFADGSSSFDSSEALGRLPFAVNMQRSVQASAGRREERARARVEALTRAHSRSTGQTSRTGTSSVTAVTSSRGSEASSSSISGRTEYRSGERATGTEVGSRIGSSESTSIGQSSTRSETGRETTEAARTNRRILGVRMEGGASANAGTGSRGPGGNASVGIRGEAAANREWRNQVSESGEETNQVSNTASRGRGTERGRHVSETESGRRAEGFNRSDREETANRSYDRNETSQTESQISDNFATSEEARRIELRQAQEDLNRASRYHELVNSEGFMIQGDISQPVAALYEQYRLEHPDEGLISASQTHGTAEDLVLRQQRLDAIAADFVDPYIEADMANDATAFDNRLDLSPTPPDLGSQQPGPIAAPATGGSSSAVLPVPASGRFDGRAYAREVGLRIKSRNVRLNDLDGRMRPAMAAVAVSASEMGLSRRVITSGADSPGVHVRGSGHGRRQAIDVRGRDLSIAQGQAWARLVQSRLGSGYAADFEVFPNQPERNHLHVQLRS